MNPDHFDLTTLVTSIQEDNALMIDWLRLSRNYEIRRNPNHFITHYNRLMKMHHRLFLLEDEGIVNREILYNIISKMVEWFNYATELETINKECRRNPKRIKKNN